MKILIADYQAIPRIGLKGLLLSAYPDATIIEAESFSDIITMAEDNAPDLIILELNTFGYHIFSGFSTIKNQFPKIPIVIFTSHESNYYAINLFKLGISGYFTKDCNPEEFTDALDFVLKNKKKYISTSLANLLVDHIQPSNENKYLHLHLTNQEFEILRLLSQGKSLAFISNKMALQLNGVTHSKYKIFKTLKIHNKYEVFKYASLNLGMAY